jgi:hypothetical protein
VFVWLTNALYLIFKFAIAHRQSFDDDIRAIRHIQARRKQTRTNLEFVHDTHRTLSTLRPQLGPVYAKGNNIGALQATSWVEQIQNFFAQAVLIFQSTSVTKPEVNGLPFAGGANIKKVWSFFL